jgi:hypothetical protein
MSAAWGVHINVLDVTKPSESSPPVLLCNRYLIGALVQLNTLATEDHFYYLTESAFT